MLIADWSASRMSSAVRLQDIGPGSWQILRRLAALEAFDGTGITRSGHPLVSGIDRFFPDLEAGLLPSAHWSFIEWVPETVGLRLRRQHRPMAADWDSVARRRWTLFGKSPPSEHPVPMDEMVQRPPVRGQRMVDETIRPAPGSFRDETPSAPTDHSRPMGEAAHVPGRHSRAGLLSALKLKTRPGSALHRTRSSEAVGKPPGLTSSYDLADLAAWEDGALGPFPESASTGRSGNRSALTPPWIPGRGPGVRMGPLPSHQADRPPFGRRVTPSTDAPSIRARIPETPIRLDAADDYTDHGIEQVGLDGNVARGPDRPGTTILTPALRPTRLDDGGVTLSETMLEPVAWSEAALAPMGRSLARLVAGAAVPDTGNVGGPGLPRKRRPHRATGSGSLLSFPPSGSIREPGSAGKGPTPSGMVEGIQASKILPERTLPPAALLPVIRNPGKDGPKMPADRPFVHASGEGIRIAVAGPRRSISRTTPPTSPHRDLPRQVAGPSAGRAILEATAMAGPPGTARYRRSSGPTATMDPVRSTPPGSATALVRDVPWTASDLTQATFLPTTRGDIPVQPTAGYVLGDDGALIHVVPGATRSTGADLPAETRQERPASLFAPAGEGTGIPSVGFLAPSVGTRPSEPPISASVQTTGVPSFRTVLGTEDLVAGPAQAEAFAGYPTGEEAIQHPLLQPQPRRSHGPDRERAGVRTFGSHPSSAWSTRDPLLRPPPTGSRAPDFHHALESVLAHEYGMTLLSPGLRPVWAPPRWQTIAGSGLSSPGSRSRTGTGLLDGYEAMEWTHPADSLLRQPGLTGDGTSPGPGMGDVFENLSLVEGTLARTLGALSEQGFRTRSDGHDPVLDSGILTYLAAIVRPDRHPRSRWTPGTGSPSRRHRGATRPQDGAPDTVYFEPGAVPSRYMGSGTDQQPRDESVRPARIETKPPGVPQGGTALEFSTGDMGVVSVASGGDWVSSGDRAPALSGLVEPGAAVPGYKGMMPLVSPALSAVAGQALLSPRADESGPGGPTGSREPEETAPGDSSSKRIDMDALAMEMAERILRRIKRDRERRGLHG